MAVVSKKQILPIKLSLFTWDNISGKKIESILNKVHDFLCKHYMEWIVFLTALCITLRKAFHIIFTIFSVAWFNFLFCMQKYLEWRMECRWKHIFKRRELLCIIGLINVVHENLWNKNSFFLWLHLFLNTYLIDIHGTKCLILNKHAV